MEKIPQEVCFDVFVKLSIKDLSQCRFVSKQWLSIISDPQFVYYHLHKIKKTNKDKLRIAINKGIGKKMSVRMVSYGSHDCKNISLPFLDEEKNDKPIELLSSCNGLLLVGTGERDHYLWNPSTGNYKQIVPSNFYHCRSDASCPCIRRVYGLGYDSVTEAYKVIRILHIKDTKRNYEIMNVRVYDCKTDGWKTIRDSFPYKLVTDGQGTIFNGAPHWIVAREDDEKQYVIVYFDLAEDVFKEVRTVLPTWFIKGVEFRFGVLEESLCLVNNNKFNAEVWVMSKDNSMSWTRLVKIILSRDGFGICHKVFDDIMKDFIPFYCNRKYDQEVRFEIGEGGKRRKIIYSDDSVCGYDIKMTTKVSLCRNEDDKEDEILAFDGPI